MCLCKIPTTNTKLWNVRNPHCWEGLHNKYGFGMSAPGLQPICGSTEAMGAEMNCVHLRNIDFEKMGKYWWKSKIFLNFSPSPHHKRWCKPPPQCINMGGLSSCSGWWIMIAILVSQVMLTMFRMMMVMMMMMMMLVMMILILVLQVIKSSSFHDHYCHHHHYLNNFQLATLNHYSGKWRCDFNFHCPHHPLKHFSRHKSFLKSELSSCSCDSFCRGGTLMMMMMMLVWFLFHKSSCSCESFCRVGTFVNFRCHAISFNGNVTRMP